MILIILIVIVVWSFTDTVSYSGGVWVNPNPPSKEVVEWMHNHSPKVQPGAKWATMSPEDVEEYHRLFDGKRNK